MRDLQAANSSKIVDLTILTNYQQLQEAINFISGTPNPSVLTAKPVDPTHTDDLIWQSRLVKLIKTEKRLSKQDFYDKARSTYGLPDNKASFETNLARLSELQYLSLSEDRLEVEYII